MKLHPLILAGLAGVALKFAVGTAPDPRNQQALLDSASVMLASNGYHIEQAVETTELTIRAARNDCRLTLVEVRPQGWNTARIGALYGAEGRIVYLYGSEVLQAAPVYRATLAYQLARLQGQLRLPVAWQPIWAVVGKPECKPESLAS